jgi:hypothetical protein
LRPEKLGDLDRGDADTAPCAKDENIFARLKFGAGHEHVPGGLEDERDRGGFFKRQILRVRQAIYFRYADELGASSVNHVAQVGELAAAIVEARQTRRAFSAGDAGREYNFLASANRGDLGADLRDFPGDVAARNVRKRYQNIRKALANPEIEVVQRAGSNAHQDFVGADDGISYFNIFQDFRAAVLLKLDGLHFSDPDFLDGSNPARTVAARRPPQSHGKLT